MKIRNFRNEFYFLSNMYPCNVHGYKCAEAAFQAAKCANPADRKPFKTMNGFDAKKMGKYVQLRPDWEEIKLDVMYAALKCKFTENAWLGKKLVATGDAYLEEANTWGDTFWGTVGGLGENHLGKLLMVLREELGGKPEPELEDSADILKLTLDALEDDRRVTDFLENVDSEYDEYFDAEEHEYKVRVKWSFNAKCGLRVTINTGKACIETWSQDERYAMPIGDELLEKLNKLAEYLYSWEPEHIPTTCEKLRGVSCDGGRHDYYVEYWDAMMERLDGEYGSDESWRDETIDYRKVVNEDWVAGCGDYVTKFMRDAYRKAYTTEREDEPEIHVRKSYELRQFEALQEKQKREDPRKIWAQKKQTPSWMPNYKSEEPAVKSGVTVKWVD